MLRKLIELDQRESKKKDNQIRGDGTYDLLLNQHIKYII